MIRRYWDNPWWIIPLLMVVSSSVLLSLIGRDAFWDDEAETWAWAFHLGRVVLGHTAYWYHAPAFYVLLGIWMEIFGDTNNAFVIRLPSAILFVLTIPPVYGIGRIIHSNRAGLLMALFLVTSPFVLDHVRDARLYSTLLFAMSISIFCLV